jgi:mRNA interferase RelE/StbE
VAEVLLIDDAIEDLRDLDNTARKAAFRGLLKLEDHPEQRGAPLGSNLGGNLTGFRKLVVGKKDYRIVYRVEDDGTVAVVTVIAKRSDNEVYTLALARIQMHQDEQIRALASPLADILKLDL